jgi:hypothetical protein
MKPLADFIGRWNLIFNAVGETTHRVPLPQKFRAFLRYNEAPLASHH